ncbi:proteasome assembly chaperone family protein [Amycolatopsis jiangsuensis]|uniref:Putative ATP-grasp superfamily ATP-dependent carboligase n=1 Tax=Amycolatopsis jiangsuensis TaxID=1181879 RepID=A0A840J106_9PSEU|nr:PAC2 family protein [Amycolatopsis jiangsuensis]MBB4688666.1 putative ATP-grasp superfamily ATP-dependent carboligase [Amycolatopsis jiangsuensis]
MGFDPEELYEVDSDVPDLDGAVLLHFFEGFMDAGSTGRLTAEHLTGEVDNRVIARFDADRLIDYRSRRPSMTFAVDHWDDYETPELVVRLLHDADGTPFLLLSGPEPDREWERFAAAVRQLVERWGVRLTVGFHGIPMGAPHTRPLGVTAHANREDLVGEHQPLPNRMQVPGSAGALLEYRLGEWGHDAMGFAAHVPHYLAQSAYPAAALQVLEKIGEATGLRLPEGELRTAAQVANAEIDRQVAESDEVADVVHALERQYDTFVAASGHSLLAESEEHMPTADELGSQFERFLAEQGGDSSS